MKSDGIKNGITELKCKISMIMAVYIWLTYHYNTWNSFSYDL